MYIRIIFLFFVFTVSATAQQADPVFLQRAITAVQTQRNMTLDAQAVCEARAVGLNEDLAKALTKIKELETPKGEQK